MPISWPASEANKKIVQDVYTFIVHIPLIEVIFHSLT